MTDLLRYTRYFASQGEVVLLQSQLTEHPSARFSFLAAQPSAKIEAYGENIITQIGEKESRYTENPWEALHDFRDRVDNWLFGYLGYDLKNHVERLHSSNPDEVKAPDLYFMNPGVLLRFDHYSGETAVLKGELSSDNEMTLKNSTDSNAFKFGRLYFQTSRKDYIQKIYQAQQHIKEGNFYEVNLSHQMKASFDGESVDLYQKMMEAGPVPFGSFMKVGDLSICCQSPERFLRKEGATVYSQPIKGTAKRGYSGEEDKSLVDALVSSEKERAENLMIVDLVRNDLSKIAQQGTVEVTELFEVQSFETVHQMVSTIKAQTMEANPVEVVKACFPMGSMTGAPKISAMKTIEKLEDYKRGIYSGAIGYITPGGDFDFNVVIRTAIIKNEQLYYSVGGAITGDSDPEREWEETQVKARALIDAVENHRKV
ncbi:aminodeoxychorismate synthase component I [Fodinibius sp. Rm-B-1B1-1]|uniref:aminodeoxychorismate synthase component I n=1 Tax=Fodinibius alkaliphilus TaxID=3140241 RepID=UPI003159AFFD